MKCVTTRISGLAVAAALLALPACSGGDSKPAPFNQADFNTSLASYMDASTKDFQDFSGDPPLVGTSQCEVDDAGKPTAQVFCKVDEYDSKDDAQKSYIVQKKRVIAAMPSDAQGGEQSNATPTTPVRFVALERDKGVVVVMTQHNDKWLVGYMFQKKHA